MTTVWQKAPPAAFAAVLHLAPLSLLHTGVSRRDWIAFGVLYAVALFALGGGLHRYFAHRSYRTSRGFQFFLAVLGACFFGDPIGFSGRHRLHHRHSDTARDIHDLRRGLWYTWIGRLLEDGYPEAEILDATRDLARYPELLWLHRRCAWIGVGAAATVWGLGGYTMFAAGYCLALCLVGIHGASAINFFGHQVRPRRFGTDDLSSNNAWLGVVMFGEGWHNNHHAYPSAARSGILWYEIDLLYYGLKLLSWTGLIWDLHEVPDAVRSASPARAA